MTAAKKLWDAETFSQKFLGQNVELAAGEVHVMPPAKTKHGHAEATIASTLMRRFYRKKPTSRYPGGWWFVVESPVKYGSANLFCHDLAGWQRSRLSENPANQYPVSVRPDWVCEILSSNIRDDRVKKQKILHAHQVPFYWLVDVENYEIRILEWDTEDYKVWKDVDLDFKGALAPFEGAELCVKVLFGFEDDDE